MTANPSTLAIAQKLLSFVTYAPDGSEQGCADYLAELLESRGFQTAQFPYEPNRPTLVAELAGSGDAPPLCFTGHLDTVPLGETPWQREPFGTEIDGDRLYGRGATDMKCGVAAIVAAVLRYAEAPDRRAGVKLVFTSGEELGCRGSRYAADLPDALGTAGALVVAEPTANVPISCHRGALWLRVVATGTTAHGSLPHLGDNAIYKVVDMIQRMRAFDFEVAEHPLLGTASLNIGTIEGGQNINSVPDLASFTIDIRTLPGQIHDVLVERIKQTLGPDAEVTRVVDLQPVETDPEHPWLKQVRSTAERFLQEDLPPKGKLAFTDAAVLTAALGNCPTVILGPGDVEMCHKTDEYCRVSKLEQAVEIYTELLRDWGPV